MILTPQRYRAVLDAIDDHPSSNALRDIFWEYLSPESSCSFLHAFIKKHVATYRALRAEKGTDIPNVLASLWSTHLNVAPHADITQWRRLPRYLVKGYNGEQYACMFSWVFIPSSTHVIEDQWTPKEWAEMGETWSSAFWDAHCDGRDRPPGLTSVYFSEPDMYVIRYSDVNKCLQITEHTITLVTPIFEEPVFKKRKLDNHGGQGT